jgi:hypothetical protein
MLQELKQNQDQQHLLLPRAAAAAAAAAASSLEPAFLALTRAPAAAFAAPGYYY